MNRYQTQARLACQISIGLMAGAFSIVPVVQASPVQDAASSYNKGGVTVVPGTVTKVTSTIQDNIVAWKDFSVAQGETVQFDGGNKTHNYLNVVTGNATSEIAGKIEGGNDVYLVNPHGVIFSKTAQVDVGNLYVSTHDVDKVVNAYKANQTGGAVLQAGNAQADIVNLGKISANKVEADGTHIRFLNSADVTAKSGVVLNAVGDDAYAHVGNAGGTDAGYTSTKSTPIDYYQLVSNATELQNIKNDLGKNYMLSEDIDASGIANFTPIGDSTTPFSGKFDGMFYEVKNLNVNTANDAGLFGDVKGVSAQSARIENFGLKNATIFSTARVGFAGGIAGKAEKALIKNVYNEDGSVSASKWQGGLVGMAGVESAADSATISNGDIKISDTAILSSYNTSTIHNGTTAGNGIAGRSGYGVSIKDTYNTYKGAEYGITYDAFNKGDDLVSVKTSYSTSAGELVVNPQTTLTDCVRDAKTTSDYTNFTISNDGTKNTTWRIYEGQSTPLLTAFLKGTVTASYNYNYFANPMDTTATTDGLSLAGVTGVTDGADIKATYNAQYFKIADSTGTKAGTTSDITFSGGVTGSDSNVVIDSRVSVNGIRNVSDSGAFISSTQHGYNIVGGNLNIAQREVKIQGGTYHITKEYDGTAEATSALLAAMNSSSSGYQVTGLLANDTVELTGIKATYQGDGTKGRIAKDADTGKTVMVDMSKIGFEDRTGGGSDKNYKPFEQSEIGTFAVTGDITPRTLYLTVNKSGFTKVYDGTTDVVTKNPDAAADKNLTIDTTKGAEHQLVTVNGAQDAITYDTSQTRVAYDTKDAGQNKTISYENISLTGANAANYRLVAENAQSASGYDILYDPSSSTSATGKLTTTGSISQRVIDPTTFSVKDANGTVSSSGTKVYDGKTAFDSTGYTLVAPQAAATGDTGIVAGENITFSIQPGKADFEDASGNKTSQVKDATQIGYDIRAVAGKDANTGGTTLLSNYVWGTGGKTLTDTDTYQVTTPGTITKRALTVQVTQPASVSLDKDYDGTTAIVSSAKYDPNGTYGKASTFGAQGYVDYTSGSLTLVTDETNQQIPTITVQAAYDNKNVNRTAAGQQPQTRNIDYTVTLSGANADNYMINGQTSSVTMNGAQTGAKGVIYPKDLTSSFAPVTKEYDGTTNMPGGWSSGGSLSGVEQGDSVSLGAGTTAQFQSKDVRGDGTTWTDASGQVWKNWVNYSNLSLTGADALNYDIQSTAQGGGTITPLALGAGDFDYTFAPLTKEYDGKTVISPADAASHLLTVTVKANKSQAQDVFKGVGVDHTANVSASYTSANSQNSASQAVNYALTILDDGSGNFTLPQGGLAVTAHTQGTITPRKVIAAAVNANLQKTYDATTAAGAGAGTLVSYTHFTQDGQPGLVGSDTDKSTGVYQASAAGKTSGEQDADAGVNKDVLYTLGIQTADPSNYEIVDANGNPIQMLAGKGTIDQRALTVTFDPTSKVYDGTPDVPQDAAHIKAHLDDGKNGQVIGADGTVLNLTKVKGEYRDASGQPISDVGTGLAVAYSNLVQALGTHAKNYIINGANGTDTTPGAGMATGTGDITKLALTNNNFHFNFQNITKEYDGSQEVAYTDRQGQSHAAASFIDEHYVDLNNNGTYDAGDVLLGGANLSGLNISSAQYADKDAGQGKAVTYTIALGNLGNYDLTQLSGAQSKNATLSYANGTLTAQTTGSITPRTVSASLKNPTAVTKVYDGGTAILQNNQPQNIMGDVHLDGLLTGTANDDGVRLDTSAGQAVYEGKDAGKNKNILYTVALTGAGAQTNYQVVDAQGNALTNHQLVSQGTGTIDKAPLTIGFGRVEKTYDAKADVTTTGSTTNGDITTITPKLSGFVNRENASFDSSATAKIKGYYTDWDGKTGMPTPDANVNLDSSTRTVKDKAVCYTGIDTAFADLASRNAVLKNYELTKAEPGAQFLSTGTSGVKDTVYFAESLGKGRIKQLSLAQGQIKYHWTSPITKEYDRTDKVLDPEKHFELYTDVTGTQIPIGYDLASAVYDNNQVDQTNGQQVGVTYTLAGISQQSLGNFIIDASTQRAYQNKQYNDGKGKITPKKIRAQLDKTSGILKTYDGTADADVKNLVFYDAQGNRLSDDGIYAKDRPQVNTAVVAAYGDKTATIDPGAAATDAKTVTYTLSLSDATGKGNYVLDGQFGTPKTANAQQNTYEGTGDIERRKVFVDFANGQPTGMDKPYDGSDTVDVSKIAGYPHIFEALPEDAQAQTGVVTVQGTKDDAEVDDASVQAAYQSRHVARDASGAPTTQDVYFWNFQLKGKDKDNYIVVANPQSQYARVVTKRGAAQQALAGSGTIRPGQVTVSLKDKNVQKEYDGTTAVVDYTDAGGTAHTYLTDNLQWNNVPIVGRGDKLVTKWVHAPAFASKDVKGTDGQGTNPVTYEFTWSNESKDGTGYHDYDVAIAPYDGQVTGQGAGATAALTATGVITPRVLTVTGAADAAKVYDAMPDLVGKDAVKNLTFARKDGSANVFGQGDTINDLLARADAKYQETAQGKGDAADATAGVAADGTSLPLLQHDVVYTNITLGNSNYALDPSSPQTVTGKGTITRASIKMTADPVSLTEGDALPSSYRGAETGWQGLDGWLGTDGANVRYAPESGQTSRTVGNYPIWAWYRTGQDAQGNDIFTKVAQSPYDKNYVLEQDPANATALAITAPTEVPDIMVPGRNFTPDRGAYNHASHDERNNVLREPQAGIAYADGGVNAGRVVTPTAERGNNSSMEVRGQGDIVNLADGDVAQGAMRDVTRPGKSFTLTGSREAYGLSEEMVSQLQAQLGTAAEQEQKASAGAQGGTAGTAPSADVALFPDTGEGSPARLAATKDAQLFGDAAPATTSAGGGASVSLFAGESAGQTSSAPAAADAAVSLFGDEPAQGTAASSEAIRVTTSPSDEDEAQREEEEKKRAAALKAKGADIGIESEGAGVNLAG